MSLPLEFDLEARLEFDQSADRYEQQRRGLGIEFIQEVNAVLTRIQQSPRSFAQIEPGIRQVCVGRFPFSVIYREEATRILVLAVLHGSRDPDIWKPRK